MNEDMKSYENNLITDHWIPTERQVTELVLFRLIIALGWATPISTVIYLILTRNMTKTIWDHAFCRVRIYIYIPQPSVQFWTFGAARGGTIRLPYMSCGLCSPRSRILIFVLEMQTHRWSGWNRARKHVYFEISVKMCVLWLPRYFRYSRMAIRVESTGTGGDRRINSSFTCIVNKFFFLKKEKIKKKRKLEVIGGEGDEIGEGEDK